MVASTHESGHVPLFQMEPLPGVLHLFALILGFPRRVLAARRERDAFRRGREAAWAYCEEVWNKPYAIAWLQLVHTPTRPACPDAPRLAERFAMAFPDSTDFLVEKARVAKPTIAAYAVRCLCCRRSFLDSTIIGPALLKRTETVTLHDWIVWRRMPLGDWVRKVIDEHNRAVKLLSEVEEVDASESLEGRA